MMMFLYSVALAIVFVILLERSNEGSGQAHDKGISLFLKSCSPRFFLAPLAQNDKSKGFLLGICILLCTLLTACNKPDALPESITLATASDQPISEERFKITYVDYLIRTGRNDTPTNRAIHLDNLIDTYLMGQEARELGYEADSSYQAYMALERKKILGGRYYETRFLDTLARPSDVDVRNAFVKQNEKVVIRHLLYSYEREARAAHFQLQAGKDFVDLANEAYNTLTYDSTAGYLGVASYWQLDDNFAEAAFALLPGEYSEPVRTRYGWHIIKVEDKTVTPILTESEYQTRKSGVESNVWMRRVRVQGNEFVREYMESLDTQWDRDVMLALKSTLKERLDAIGYNAQRTLTLTQEEINPLRATLRPDAVLATYTWRGQEKSFTVADYVFWLETLPVNEVYYRAGASMGRALRNEVFALNGEAEGLEKDATYKENMQHVGTVRLATRLQREAIENYTGQPTEEQIAEAAKRMKLLSVKERRADLRYIEFETFEEAKAAEEAIETRQKTPRSYGTYSSFVDVSVDTLQRDLHPYIEKAPLNEWTIVGTATSWYLLNVSRTVAMTRTIDEVRLDVVASLSKQLPIIDLISELRDRHEVELDTLLFKQQMRSEGLVVEE